MTIRTVLHHTAVTNFEFNDNRGHHKRGRKSHIASRIKGGNINSNHLLFHNAKHISGSCASTYIGESNYDLYSTLAYKKVNPVSISTDD